LELDEATAPKLIAINEAFASAGLPYAFGGAIALAYCIREPRATVDLDINVFVAPAEAQRVLDALPSQVARDDADRELLERDGQVRMRWGVTSVDLFLSTDVFHDAAAKAIRHVPFGVGDVVIPVLGCEHLAVFKAFFARPKDFVDIGNMVDARSFDVASARKTIARYLGTDAAELVQFDAAVADGRDPDRNEPRFFRPKA
jgi:hypothetical protein